MSRILSKLVFVATLSLKSYLHLRCVRNYRSNFYIRFPTAQNILQQDTLFSSDFSLLHEWVVHNSESLSEFLYESGKDICPTKSSAKRLIRRGLVIVNGFKRKTDHLLLPGDVVQTYSRSLVSPTDIQLVNSNLHQEDLKVSILFEDNDCAVVVKPQGMPVYPQNGTWSLHSALFISLSSSCDRSNNKPCTPLRRPRMVHRLDQGLHYSL